MVSGHNDDIMVVLDFSISERGVCVNKVVYPKRYLTKSVTVIGNFEILAVFFCIFVDY